MNDRHYKPKDVAARYGVKIDTVRRWIHSGELAAIDVSSKQGSTKPRFVVSAAGLAEFEARRAVQKPVKQEKRRRKTPSGLKEYF